MASFRPLTALLAMLALGCAASAQAATTLRLAHFAAETHPGHLAAKQLKERVEARTKGEVKVEIFPNNQLGSPPDQLEQTKLGVIDMSLPTQGALDKYEKAFATVLTPFAFRDYAHAHKVLDGPFAEWVAPRLEKQGLVMLSSWEYGFRNVTNSKRPINSPDDMRGLKLRTPPELQIVAALEAAGASTTQIAFPELPSALNQGVVDGQENPIGVIFHFKLHEMQAHLALTQHVYNSMVHVIGKAAFDRLTAEHKTILREESRAAGALMRKLVVEQEDKELAEMAAKGIKITRPDLAAFKAKMGPAFERVGAYAGKDNMAAFLKMIE